MIRCSFPTGDTLTFGEMEPDAKHAISHRARAFRAFASACLGDARRTDDATQASASTCIGRSAPPSAPTATSTATCAPAASTRRASCAAYLRELRALGRACAGRRRGQHLLRRRHAVADVGGDGRLPSSTRSLASGGSSQAPRSRSRPIRRASRRRASATTARPASTACRSACSPSTTPTCGRWAACTRRRRRVAAIDVARETFERFSFDLIYARPGQTRRRPGEDELGQALALAGRHLSLYQLTIEQGTPFAELHARGKLRVPDSERGARLLRADAGDDRARPGCRPTRSPTTPRRARSAGTTCSTGATASTRASAPAPTAASSIGGTRRATVDRAAARALGSPASRPTGTASWKSTTLEPEPSRPTRRC